MTVIDHFHVTNTAGSNIPTQNAGEPFNIQVAAHDAAHSVLTGFTGTVGITSTGTLSSGAGTTAAFVAGVLASHSVTISNTGTFTITATRNLTTGISNSFQVNVPTTTSVVSSLNPSIYGTGVSFTATVIRSTGSGTPTGSVQFKIDGSNSGSPVALGAPATATSATAVSASSSTLTAGTHTVEAVYIPTSAFGASTGTLSPVQTVNQKALTVSFTADNKVYDGTTAATILTRTLGGVIAPDVVTPGGGTATFADKNVGTGKMVTGTGFTLSGADAANYTISPNSATTTANINPASADGELHGRQQGRTMATTQRRC